MSFPSLARDDEYGVPLEVFGSHASDFFPLLGRVVALSAVVEYNLRALACKLVSVEICRTSTVRTTDVVKAATGGLAKIGDETSRAIVGTYLEDVGTFLPRRDAYVHSMWPAVSLERGQRVAGWRIKPGVPDLELDANLDVLRDDVKRCSELVMRWNREILPLVIALPWLQMVERA